MSNLYEVVFAGELVPGADAAQVEANLARLFQADPQRIAALFSGRRIVIKSNLDGESAEKYRQTLERAGARVEVSALGAVAAVVPAVEAAPPAVGAAAGEFPALQVTPRDEYMAAFRDVTAPDFGLAPVGVDLQEQRPAPAAPALDLSQLSVAPVGSDLGEARAAPSAVVPDTAYLKLLD